ncbi:hypothetical protein PybrP1_009656 [[Pythium] brassicae (nom. inval.)]|nr:hypothetical protein PybrP1_009656 [[Pythium] brassicae (nom. inval.)]
MAHERASERRRRRRRRVSHVLLASADVNVVNRTTLSLWHFQQLAQQLLPRAATADEPETEADFAPPVETAPEWPPAVALGEGMRVAAVAFEAEEAGATDDAPTDDSDAEDAQQEAVGAALAPPLSNALEDACLAPATQVGVVYNGYRCVVCLDASPSTLSIDPTTGRLFLDMLYESVELFIWGLLRKMTVGDGAFVPEIHLSVMVQGAHVESLSVLVQGYIVNLRNVAPLLQMIKDRVRLIEDDWAKRVLERDLRAESEQRRQASTRASLSWMLQNAVFAVNSLPGSTAPLLVVVTDGVVDLFDAYSYDNLLMQLVRHDVQCSFLRVGGGSGGSGGGGDSALNASFGFVPDVDLLDFIASTTGGAVLDYVALHAACYGPTRRDAVTEMTSLQAACFLRMSSVHAIASPVMKLDELCCTSFDGRTLLPLRPYRMWREKVHEYRIFADVERIIEARVREGFTINKMYVKTSARPRTEAAGASKRTADSPRGVEASASASEAGDFQDVTKILVVFLLQWKQNVWLEYVVSTTIESDAGGASAGAAGRRASAQGLASSGFSSAKKPLHDVFKKEQTYDGKWSEWYVKVNILAYSDFLRAFEDSAQLAGGGSRSSLAIAGAGAGSPSLLHEFIRSVQDVDRVLLHLVTAVATAIASADAGSQYSFGITGNASSSAAHSRQQSAHPVFNIIGELTPVLWHRWFYVERFELLCVVKNEACSDMFYRHEDRDVSDRTRSARKGLANPSRGFLQLHQGGYRVHTVAIGVERITERLMATLQKWSSQRLSRDLFLRFLQPTWKERHLLRSKASASASSTGGVGRRQQLRPAANAQAGGMGWQPEESASIDGGSSSSLCFVRLEVKSKTLCAVHVAFFSTPAAARKQTLGDLKASIMAGVNEAVPPSPSVTPDQAPAPAKTAVVSQRLISRLLVTHETLLLHDDLDGTGAHDHASWEASGGHAVSSCCGGSELQLRSVFGAYMWHSNWRWHIANPAAILNVMQRLHEARVESGFWVLDWRMENDDDESQASQLQSIIFGREIVMEDENGNAKTSLVQYALRRVSESCLMTSIWMEPQHGTVKTRLSSHVEQKDRFHWGLRHAVGHDSPFDEVDSALKESSASGTTTAAVATAAADPLEDERQTMEKEDVRVDWSGSMYLGENDLLQLIRGYIFKSDRHFLSCLYTFDCVVNYRTTVPHLPYAMDKDVDNDDDDDDVVGAAWNGEMFGVAALKQLLPPFSTARLLRSAKRRTERFLMYLESGADEAASESGGSATMNSPRVSLANEHLYSMLERTLRGLSDCEVAWTDSSGTIVSEDASLVPPADDGEELIKEGMSGQMPLWLKEHISLSFQDDDASESSLSEGRCFAKLVGEDTVVLAFLPSLETLQVRKKPAPKSKRRGSNPTAPLADYNPPWPTAEPRTARGSPPAAPTPAMEPSANSRLLRMSVSADDIVLYQERRLSFREGYKSWRMGHYQGSRDDKQSSGSDFRTAHQASVSDDHEFCAEISQQTAYGCDFHVLIANDSGAVGSGFFQVAFYECSVTRLSSFQGDSSRRTESASRFDLPQLVLKKLFVSSPTAGNPRDEVPVVAPAGKEAAVRTSLASPAAAVASPMTPKPVTAVLSASSVASRRFQKKVKRAHEHNFSRGVYIALREGSNVQQSDLLQALTSCVEIPVDLDITLLYRMMQASSPKHGFQSLVRGSSQSVLKAKLDKAFEAILSSAFVPIPGTKYYYFTGSEAVVAFEDVGEESEYELQVLMDDAEEVSSSAVADDDISSTTGGAAMGSDGQSGGADSGGAKAFSLASKPPLAKASPRASGADMTRSGRRLTDQRRPPPVKTTPSDVQLIEQLPGVEEDAEFNKEVAVATSSFSAPFFFRFECREVSSLHAKEGSGGTADLPPAPRDSLQRSVSTQSFIGMRNEWLAKKNQATARGSSDDDTPDESRFDALLSKNERRDEEVAHVAEWFATAPTTRIALRLVTLTLPNEQGAGPIVVARHSPSSQQRTQFDMDDSVHGGGAKPPLPSRAQVFSALPLFQRQALKRVRQDIKEWCSMEVLDILRAANAITPAISELVQRLFDDLPPHAVTKATYPLGFVAGSLDAAENPIELLKKELENGTTALRVHHSNGVYFVVEPKQPPDGSDTVMGSVADNARAQSFEIPYWAFLTVENDRISLQLHHPAGPSGASAAGTFDRLGVLTRLHLGVLEACKRVNQFLLLLQLHETRSCSDLLLPAPSNQVASPRSPRRKDSGSASFASGGNSEPFFWPGQFQCELQYSALFKLHERLSPTMALNMLCTSALEQFQVHNRRHVFVYRDRGGHVFYMKMSIKQEQAPEGDKLDRKRVTRLGVGNGAGAGGAGGGTPSSASPSAGVTGILLEVFGVCAAGEEVAQELCRVLERKLDEATQLILMKLLARNAKFQLSASDLAFVCPPDGRPTQVVEFVLPPKFEEAASLLQFLSQTLSSATYVRTMSNAGASTRGLGEAAGELGSALGARRRSLHAPEKESVSDSAKPVRAHDPRLSHPSMFFVVDEPVVESRTDPEMVSPVFLSPRGSSPAGLAAPVVEDQASFVLNLNPELRLSSGFLSRIGKGLAVFRLELIRNHVLETDAERYDHHAVKSLQDFDGSVDESTGDASEATKGPHRVVRCQMWIRGSIVPSELVQLLESNLREAMLDYQIEATLKAISDSAAAHQAQPLSEPPAAAALPQEVQYLSSLFETSWDLSSATVTKLRFPSPIAPWDVQHVVQQLQSFLQCVPSRLRPSTFSKARATSAYVPHEVGAAAHGELWSETRCRQYFRLVPRLHVPAVAAAAGDDASNPEPSSTATDRSIASHPVRGATLNHSDSIQSEMSDMDRLPLAWASTGTAELHRSGFNQLALSTGTLPTAATMKEFAENELLHYQKQCVHAPASTGSNADAAAAADSECCTRRSFYYVIDVSCSGGLQVHGYNMSAAVVDALLVQLARILTWSKLREALVRSLLLEKSGLPHAAPLGRSVVQPRELYVSGRGSAVGKHSLLLPKDFSVSFVEFWKPAVAILTANAAFPRLLDASLLRLVEQSSLGKYLREAHTLASDHGEVHRPRAPSNASLKAAGSGILAKPELHRDVSSQSSSRSLRGVDTGGAPNALSASSRSGSSTALKLERSAPSPTKRGLAGGSAASGYNGTGQSGGGAAAAAGAPRMRGNAGAATALLAARARARGALPNRPGGGPGASSKPASGDSVAPWDLPLTNTKGPVLTGSGAPMVPRAGASVVDAAGSTTGNGAAASGLPTVDTGLTGSGFGASFSRPGSLEPNDAASVSFSWRKQLEFAWGPRFQYHDSVASQALGASATTVSDEATAPMTDTAEQRRKNPLGHLSEALQKRWQQLEDRSTSHSISLNLFEKLVHMTAGDEMDEAVSLGIVRRMMQSGHELARRRFRVTFVERWEAVKVDDEYMEADMQDGRLRALQASMDLVNLLSYKKELVFAGNECTIANFYTEHTVVGMCASEGDAVREMKKQIMKNIFQLRMEVAHAFYEQYAVHLRALGFRHLSTLAHESSVHRAGRLGSGPSASAASLASLASLSVGSALAGADSDGFAEYFYFPGKAQGKLKGWQVNAASDATAATTPASLLLLELKSDHHGVQLSVVLVHERDLAQHALGFQSHLAAAPPLPSAASADSRVSGGLVACVTAWLRDALRTRAIIYSFTIRFFQNYLTKWSNDQREREPASHDDVGSATDPDATAALAAAASLSASGASLALSGHDVHSFQNIVKGIRCFLHAYPEPPSERGATRGAQPTRECLLRTAVVELPPTQLHSNCSESILVKILLRYIACHGARYEVLDLMQFGTPDAVVCHSPSGSFFHRQPTSSGPTPFGYLPPRERFAGYSLLITTQSLAEGFGLQARDKKRRKNCIQLILLKGDAAAGAAALGVGTSVLPVERALLEAEFFVQELFRVAAQHYERDLLWSRLLYDDRTGPGARVAATLALPATHFQVDVGPQQLEECLRLSVCTPLDEIDPTLAQLLDVDNVCWQEFALRLRDVYADQLREYQFAEEQACHFLLLCPNTHDLIIHLTFESGVPEPLLLDFGSAASSDGADAADRTGNGGNGNSGGGGRVKIEICRREEPPNRRFTFAQRRVITDFVNSIVHWQWRSLLYD